MKEKLWNEINDPSSTDSLMEVSLKIEAFFQKSQLELITPYFAKYYAGIKDVVEKRDREFALVYMRGLSPTFMVRDEDINQVTDLLTKFTDPNHFFTLFLKKELETMEVRKKARELCIKEAN